MSFNVHGKHVIVVGAGRSGARRPICCVSRGARVTLADTRDDARRRRPLRATASRSISGRTRPTASPPPISSS